VLITLLASNRWPDLDRLHWWGGISGDAHRRSGVGQSIPLGAIVRLLPSDSFQCLFKRLGLLGRPDVLPTTCPKSPDTVGWKFGTLAPGCATISLRSYKSEEVAYGLRRLSFRAEPPD
ncbi:hypothetical protein C8R47DRAFT_1313978, partial [Mycena vitilis]